VRIFLGSFMVLENEKSISFDNEFFYRNYSRERQVFLSSGEIYACQIVVTFS
jgi:hypothetical protein